MLRRWCPQKTPGRSLGTSKGGHSICSATRVSGENRPAFGYRMGPKPAGNREIRRLLVADAIGQGNNDPRGTYGYRMVKVALRIERDPTVNPELVGKVMAVLGPMGPLGRKPGNGTRWVFGPVVTWRTGISPLLAQISYGWPRLRNTSRKKGLFTRAS